MRVDVAFLPSLVTRPERTVCVVVDVLRATSTLATLAGNGVREVVVVADLDRAFALRRAAEQAGVEPPLLCGEVGGLPPSGFDYGNSPAEFSRLDVGGRAVVLFTSNGTRALMHVARSPGVFAGSLLNCSASVEAALAAARPAGLNVTFVCSGTDLGTAYCLEDAFCAGALTVTLLDRAVEPVQLGDGAQTALRLCRSFDGNALAAFAAAEHGALLPRIGLAADVDFCARQDLYAVAPQAQRRDGRVVVRTA